jgi:hypothetical protein
MQKFITQTEDSQNCYVAVEKTLSTIGLLQTTINRLRETITSPVGTPAYYRHRGQVRKDIDLLMVRIEACRDIVTMLSEKIRDIGSVGTATKMVQYIVRDREGYSIVLATDGVVDPDTGETQGGVPFDLWINERVTMPSGEEAVVVAKKAFVYDGSFENIRDVRKTKDYDLLYANMVSEATV